MGFPQGGDIGWGLGQGPSVLEFGLSFRGSLVYKELFLGLQGTLPFHECGTGVGQPARLSSAAGHVQLAPVLHEEGNQFRSLALNSSVIPVRRM